MQLMTTGSVTQAVHILSHVARPRSAQREGIWDMAIIEQFIAPHRGVCTNHSVWNANCDKNWFTLSTGSFPTSWTLARFMKLKYNPENAYSCFKKRS